MDNWDGWLDAIKSKNQVSLLDSEAINMLNDDCANNLAHTNVATSQLYVQGSGQNEFMQFAYLRYDVSDDNATTFDKFTQFKYNDIKVDVLDFLNLRDLKPADAQYHEMLKQRGLNDIMQTEEVLDNEMIVEAIQSTAVELKTHGKLSDNTRNVLQKFKDHHWAIAASADWKEFTITEWHFVLEHTKSKSLSVFILSYLMQTLLSQYYQQHKVALVKRTGLPAELLSFAQCILDYGQIFMLEPSKFREVLTNMHLELCPQPLGLNMEQEFVKQYSNKFRQ